MSVNTLFLEHRWGIRGYLGAAAELRITPAVSAIAKVREASLSGAFVETGAPPALHASVAIRPIHRSGVWLNAQVVRVEETGIAVEWRAPRLDFLAVLLTERAP